jgi:hypothetical protein
MASRPSPAEREPSGATFPEGSLPVEPTPLLGTLRVRPDERGRIQQSLGAASADPTRELFLQSSSCEVTAPVFAATPVLEVPPSGVPAEAAIALESAAAADDEIQTPDVSDASPAASGVAWTFPIPVDDELTAVEAGVLVDREPGLGQVAAKRSDVRELLSKFHVTEVIDEPQLLAVLRRTVEGYGTPLPPAVEPLAKRSHRR